MACRCCRRRPSSPFELLLAQSTWQLWGDDALDVAGALTSWPARVGPNAILDAPFGTPTVVVRADLNNRKVVRFAKGNGDLLLVDGAVNTVVGDHTLMVFHAPDLPAYYDAANLDRGYITVANNGNSTRLALGVHTANDQRVPFSHRYRGFYNGAADGDSTPNAGWHNFTRSAGSGGGFVFSQGGPQAMTQVLGSPLSYHVIDDIVEGTSAFYVTKLPFYGSTGGPGRHTIGGETTEVDPTGHTFYGGDIFQILYFPFALTLGQVAILHEGINAYNGWTPRTYALPTEVQAARITAWWSSRRNYTAADAEPNASEWPDMLARVPLAATGGVTPVNGVATFDGVDDEYTSSVNITELTNPTEWTAIGRALATAISTSAPDGTIYQNDVQIRDQSGFWGILCRETAPASGIFEQVAFQWDTAARSAKATITLNTEFYYVARYNGTLQLKLNGGAWVTATCGAMGGNGTTRVGGLTGGTTQQFAGFITDIATWDVALSDAEVAQVEAYLQAQV